MRSSNAAYITLIEFDNQQNITNIASFEQTDLAPYKAIDFANSTTGYVVGANGIIRKNTTGNNTNTISKIDNNLIKLFPNPSNGQILIQFIDHNIKPTLYTITDLQGKKIYQTQYYIITKLMRHDYLMAFIC